MNTSSATGTGSPVTVRLSAITDGQNVFAIWFGGSQTFKIVSGEHRIGVACFGGWSPSWKEDWIAFDLIPGDKVYFLISPNLWSCASIEEIDEDELFHLR